MFTQTVAAIPARGTVEVTLRYDTVARYRAGTWELVLPMVVAPRYAPGVATSRPTTGTGRAPDTDRAPDASRVTPPGGPGAGGATEVIVRFTDKVVDPQSPTHELRVTGTEAAFSDPRTDHDTIVRWRAAAPAAGWVEQGPDGGYAAVILEAPAAAQAPRRGAVRCLLVLDRSAASLGDAAAVARPFVRALLGGLGGADRAAVAGSDAIAWSAPADAARALEQAWEAPAGAFDLTRVLLGLRPEGGAVVLVTSGLVADDAAAVAAARKLGVPIHVVGVGPAPARGLLGQIAAATGGTLRYLTVGDDLGALARATLADAAAPPAPLAVNWGALAASERGAGDPAAARRGAGRPRARPRQAGAGGERARAGRAVRDRGAAGGASRRARPRRWGPLARRWARARLEELIAGRAAPAAITAHALRYGLVSPYTSLVAVGDEVVVEGGVKRSVAVPVSVPAGMRWQAVKRQTTVDTGAKDATVAQGEADQRDVVRKADEAGTRRGKRVVKEAEEDDDGDDKAPKHAAGKTGAKAEREQWKRPADKRPDRDAPKKKTAEPPADRVTAGRGAPWIARRGRGAGRRRAEDAARAGDGACAATAAAATGAAARAAAARGRADGGRRGSRRGGPGRGAHRGRRGAAGDGRRGERGRRVLRHRGAHLRVGQERPSGAALDRCRRGSGPGRRSGPVELARALGAPRARAAHAGRRGRLALAHAGVRGSVAGRAARDARAARPRLARPGAVARARRRARRRGRRRRRARGARRACGSTCRRTRRPRRSSATTAC